MENVDALLEKLTLAVGVGYGGDIQRVIAETLSAENIRCTIGDDGSVSAHLKGSGKHGIMLACHIDEIGYMVSRIDDDGRIFFTEIGGVDVRILPGQEVTVLGKKTYSGYVGVKPPHLVGKDERSKVLPLTDLFIDIGTAPAVVKKNVGLGDYIAFAGKYQKLQGDLRSVKALDNRASVACGILAMQALAKMDHGLSVYFVATSQEEYTGLGARTYAYKLPLDYAVVVDVSHAEYPDLKEHEVFPLDGGPTIVRGATVPAKMHDLLVATAKGLEIPYQVEPVPSRTGTDADDIAFNREGIPTCIIGIPLRYMHTPVEIVSLKDIERAARLITHFIKKLGDEPLHELK